MKAYNKSEKNIILSFVIVALLVVMLGVLSVFKMIELSSLTQKLYEHSLVVTNSTQNIQTHLVSMYRHMKDVVLSLNKKELQIALDKVNKNEKIIFDEFAVVFEKYLGDKEEIRLSYNLFVVWKDIRAEVVELMYQNNNVDAIKIAKQKGAVHVAKLNKSVEILVEYAHKKGKHFVSYANKTKNLSISLIIAVVLVVLVLITSIVVVLLRNLSNAAAIMKQQNQQLVFQSRLAQMGEMISMIAHQWRQPLAAIASTSIDLKMKMELGTFDLNEEDSRNSWVIYLNDKLDSIDSFVQDLTNTIDDFRYFYKPNKKKEYTQINDPIQKTLSIIANSLKTNNITLVQDYYSNKKLNFNSSEIMQVLLNIFKNAEDNFKIKNIKDATIWITTTDTDYGICIKVCDNGGGVEKNIINKIFNPYFSTKYEKNGTGLGLYMSKIIVEEHHGGKIIARNTTHGVCFDIALREML